MRTITTVDLGSGRTADDVSESISHLYVHQLEPTGDELRKLYRALPKHIQRAQGGDVPGPDHPEIETTLHDAGYEERTADWYRAADGLSLICQATIGELTLDSIEGSTTVLVAHSAVNGLVSSQAAQGRAQFTVRLRGTPDALYPATEAIVRTVLRTNTDLVAASVSSISKERGNDQVFERLEVKLIRKGGVFPVLRAARKDGLIDGAVFFLVALAVVGFCASWTLHFRPSWFGVDNWAAGDISWLDGWIGRLSTSAIFALITTVGVILFSLRRSFASEDGMHLTMRWRR